MRITVVTPSLNQGPFIERTVRSVLSQRGNFELEYVVVDGGSRDATPQVIDKYRDQLTWISGKDSGQSDAINKGFEIASGDILSWLNSDDTYEPGALSQVATAYEKTQFKWCIGNCRIIDENDEEIRRPLTRYRTYKCRTYSYGRLLAKNFIPQPAVFFDREVFQETGPLCLDCHYAMDYDYWLRLGQRYRPHYIDRFLANFRWHRESKCGQEYKQVAYEAYLKAKAYSTRREWFSILQNYLHYRVLSVTYRLYDAIPSKRSS